MTLKISFLFVFLFLDLTLAEKDLLDRGEEGQKGNEGGKLALPRAEECAKSQSIQSFKSFSCDINTYFAGIRHEKWNNTWYFFSWDYEPTKNLKVTWFQARNICRRHCMDTVSLGKENH